MGFSLWDSIISLSAPRTRVTTVGSIRLVGITLSRSSLLVMLAIFIARPAPHCYVHANLGLCLYAKLIA